MAVTYANSDPTITVIDSAGNSYARAIKTYDAAHNQGCAIFYSINILGGASHTVTVNFSAPVAYLALGIHEYTAVASLDVTSGSIGDGASISSGSATTTADGDLLFGAAVEDQVGHGDTFTPTNSFIMRVDLGIDAAYADEDEIQSAAAPAASTFTLSPALAWIADLAAFRPSTADGSAGPSITTLSPTSGSVGTSVTITGQRFGVTQGNSVVNFNGTFAAITSWSDTQIVAVVQNGSITGDVNVNVSGVGSNRATFTVLPPSTSIHHVQLASNSDISGATFNSFSAAFPSSTTTGNAVILAVAYGNVDAAITATDAQGNPYALAIKTYDAGHNQGCAILYSTAITGGVSPAVTVNFAAPVAYLALGIHEYTGVSTLDVTSGNMGDGTNPSSGSATTTANGDLIFGCGVEDILGHGDTFTPGAGFTKRVDLGVDAAYADEDEVLPLAGPVALTWSLSPAGLSWIADMAAFKPSVATAPTITNLSPTSGPIGSTVTITGANFGATQGTSTVTFNGTAATPTSWSGTQIVTTVPAAATSGPVQVTVSAVGSNTPSFIVGTPPSITAGRSPAPNAAGWNNTNVTVTFTCTAGSSQVTNCPGPQTASTEGSNVVVTGTATDANGLMASVNVTLKIDKAMPTLAVTSPVDGSTVSSSPVTVTGAVSDTLSGVTSVTCNGASAALSSGSFSCNISLTVGVNLIMVRATDAAGNVAASNVHVTLSGNLPAPQALQITPATANVPVAGTQGFSVVDQIGQSRPDATWTVSDTTIATITADSSPTLTGVAVGQVTLTATVQSMSTQIQVNIIGGGGGSLPPGTVLWSAPPIPGFNTTQIIQAEPVENGPDLYSVAMNPDTRDVVIRAVTGDGKQMWSRTFPGTEASAIADGNGGILVSYSYNGFTPIVDLDAQTGGTLWENDLVYLRGQQSDLAALEAIAPNGTIHVAGLSGNYALNAKTGAATMLQPSNAPQGVLKYIDPCNGPGHSVPYLYASAGSEDGRGASVGADGTVFQVVSTMDLNFLSGCSSVLNSFSLRMYLSQTAPDGTATFTLFDTETSLVANEFPFGYLVYVPDPQDPLCHNCTVAGSIPPYTQFPSSAFFQVVPDGQGGAFVPWWKDLGNFPNYEAHLSHVSGGSATDVIFPLTYQNTAFLDHNACPGAFRPGLPCTSDFRVVLGENGVGFATDLKSVVAFDQASMGPLWTHTSASGMDIVAATADGGVTINDFQQGLVHLDANGSAGTPSGNSLLAVTPWALGNWMGDPDGGFAKFAGPSTAISTSWWPEPNGDRQGQNRSRRLEAATFMPIAPGTDSQSNPRFGSTQDATKDLKNDNNVPHNTVSNVVYTDFGKQLGTIRNFIAKNGTRFDVLAFIGDSDVIICSTPSDPYCSFSAGLNFVDDWLIRTPNCDTPALGLCYHPDTTNPVPPPCGPGAELISGSCYQLHPPCLPAATQIGNSCFRLPLGHNGFEGQTTPVILTGANVVFVASCRTTDVFAGWWNMTLNALPGGRALVVPDIVKMAALPFNQGNVSPQNQGFVDLVQGAVGYEAFLKTLGTPQKTIQDALKAANDAIAAVYPTLDYTQNASGRLPQVIYEIIGNQNLCLTCGGKQ